MIFQFEIFFLDLFFNRLSFFFRWGILILQSRNHSAEKTESKKLSYLFLYLEYIF